MLEWLEDLHKHESNPQQIHRSWHELMEKGRGEDRKKFYTRVVKLAEEASGRFRMFRLLPNSLLPVKIAATATFRDEKPHTRGWTTRQPKI